MKIKKIQKVKVYFVNDDAPQWFWIEIFTDFNDPWVWAYDGESEKLEPMEMLNTRNITYIYFEKDIKTFEIRKLNEKNDSYLPTGQM